jgi:hypothetical protein
MDKHSGLIHSVEATSANVHDISEQPSFSMGIWRWSTETPDIKELRSEQNCLARAQHSG